MRGGADHAGQAVGEILVGIFLEYGAATRVLHCRDVFFSPIHVCFRHSNAIHEGSDRASVDGLTLAAKWILGVLQELGFVFWGERLGFGSEFCLGFVVEFGRSCSTGGDRGADLREELFLACG